MSKEFDVEKETAEVESLYGDRLEQTVYLSGEELAGKTKESFLDRKDKLRELLDDETLRFK